MDFSKEIILEDDRIRLEPLSEQHIPHFVYYAENQIDIWKYSLVPASGAANMKTYVEQAIQDRNLSKSYSFAVYDKLMKVYVGTSRFYNIEFDQKNLLIGYTWYAHEAQGTSVNKRCKFLMLSYAYDILQMERIEFRADSNNERSIQAIKSLGCLLEGTLRSNAFRLDGVRRDTVVLSMLKVEWVLKYKTHLADKIKEYTS